MVVQIDHRFVVIGGLLLACIYYPVPFYIVVAIIIVGCAIYYRNNDITWLISLQGWRMSLGLTGSVRGRDNVTAKRLKFRQNRVFDNTIIPITSSPLVKSIISSDNSKEQSVTPLGTCRTRLWGQNVSTSTPVFRFDYANYCNRIGTKCQLNMGEIQSTPSYSKAMMNNSPSGSFKPTNMQDMRATASIGSRMDSSSIAKAEPSYNAVCQTKYTGIGIYPTIHLEPQRPITLSNTNSIMTRNRVTVKIAPLPKPVSPQFKLNNVIRQQSPATHSSEGNIIVVQGLTSRKRPNLDGSRTVKKRQRKDQVDVVGTSLVAFNQSKGLQPNMEPLHSEDCIQTSSMQVSHLSRDCDQSPKLNKQPTIIFRSGINAISSSYSSSVAMIKQEQKAKSDKRHKRKSDIAAVEAPLGKMSRSKLNLESAKSETISDDVVEHTESGNTNEELVTPDSKREHKTNIVDKPTAFYSALAGTKSPIPTYIPSYIPSMSDYWEDQKSNRHRLHKMLNCLSSKNARQDKSSTSDPGKTKTTGVDLKTGFVATEPSVTSPPSASVTVSDAAEQSSSVTGASVVPITIPISISQANVTSMEPSSTFAISQTTAVSIGTDGIMSSASHFPVVAVADVAPNATFATTPQFSTSALSVASNICSPASQFSDLSAIVSPTLTNSVETPISTIPSDQSSSGKNSEAQPITTSLAPFTFGVSSTPLGISSTPNVNRNALLVVGAPNSTAVDDSKNITFPATTVSAVTTSLNSQPTTFTFANTVPQLRSSNSAPVSFGAIPATTSAISSVSTTDSLFAVKSSSGPSITSSSTNSFTITSPSMTVAKPDKPTQQIFAFGQRTNTNNFNFVPPLPPPPKTEAVPPPPLFQFRQPVTTTSDAKSGSVNQTQNMIVFGDGKPAGDTNSGKDKFKFTFGSSNVTPSFGTNGGTNFPSPTGFGSTNSNNSTQAVAGPFGTGNSNSVVVSQTTTTQQSANNAFNLLGNSASTTASSTGFPTFTYSNNGSDNNTFKFGQSSPPNVIAPSANSGFSFNPTFKPSLNFVPNSTPLSQSSSMFSIGSSNTAPRRITKPGSKYRPKS